MITFNLILFYKRFHTNKSEATTVFDQQRALCALDYDVKVTQLRELSTQKMTSSSFNTKPSASYPGRLSAPDCSSSSLIHGKPPET